MIEFVSGAVTLAYLVGSIFFLRFWRRTRDRLFLSFAIAFGLQGLCQALAFVVEFYGEPSSLVYSLRVVGFVVILAAIVDKNVLARRGK